MDGVHPVGEDPENRIETGRSDRNGERIGDGSITWGLSSRGPVPRTFPATSPPPLHLMTAPVKNIETPPLPSHSLLSLSLPLILSLAPPLSPPKRPKISIFPDVASSISFFPLLRYAPIAVATISRRSLLLSLS